MSKNGNVWSSFRINEEIKRIENGLSADYTPFVERDVDWRTADIVFEYTKEEVEEITKCANDVTYFAERYCYSMTDEGIRRIKLWDYQTEMLKTFQENRHCVLLASRQIGKTVTSAMFIAWYLCFNVDRNVMVVANKMDTAKEIIDKIKVVISNLPFFMKPGTTSKGITGMKFDNGCKLYAQATTKTAAIGFTIHLLFADEFAHIHQNFITHFYRSIYPTLSSSKVSKIIISSTPNGMNKFYEIYQGAMEGKNSYKPIRVDWWQVPGRDDAWKDREIANLGSIEIFNQEYGNQFLSSARLLLHGDTLKFIKRVSKKYIWREVEEFQDIQDISDKMRWHPEFSPNSSLNRNKKYVMSVDVGDGVGKDYSVINIFELEVHSLATIKTIKDYRDESDFFRLKQIGLFHSNSHSVEELATCLEVLVFEVFDPENIKIVLEINFKGSTIYDKISRNANFFPELFLHTRHSAANPITKPGVKLQKDNKQMYCRELRTLIALKKVVINEDRTFEELSSFGINSQGNYSSQMGHDDISMSCVNLVALFDSYEYTEMIEDIIDTCSDKIRRLIDNKMEFEDTEVETYKMVGEILNEESNFNNSSLKYNPKKFK